MSRESDTHKQNGDNFPMLHKKNGENLTKGYER